MLAALLPGAAHGFDVPLPGRSLEVRPAKAVRLSVKRDEPFALPAPGSLGDPTIGGATLRFFDIGGDAGSVAFPLDASGWKGLGKPAGARGWKYRGRADAADPDPKGACRSVVLKAKSWKASCKGTGVVLEPPFAAAAAATLDFPAAAPASRYCAVFGGDEKTNDAARAKRKKSEPPVACPVAPGEFAGFEPDDVATLASDAFAGRQNLTPGSEAAQAFLIGELSGFASGLDGTETGDAAYRQPFAEGTNILAVLPGGELADEYVVIGGHYDHLGTSCPSSEPGDDVCNGATDNAAGVAAVLAIGRQIARASTPPRRSLVLAFWDAEEDGLRGSLHYGANPLVPFADTVAYLNFDLLGANLLPGLRNDSFAIGSETGGTLLSSLLDGAVALETLDTRPVSLAFGQGRSDHVAFTDARVPTVFFGDSTGGCYHTAQDEVDVVDVGKLERQTRIGYYLARALLEGDRPLFEPDTPLATFGDVERIREVFERGLADVALFAPDDQTTLLGHRDLLEQLVADGEAAFDPEDVEPFLAGTASALGLLPTLACDGFLE